MKHLSRDPVPGSVWLDYVREDRWAVLTALGEDPVGWWPHQTGLVMLFPHS